MKAMNVLLTVLLTICLSVAHALRRGPGTRRFTDVRNVSEDLLSRCKVHHFETNLDHFSRVCDRLQSLSFPAEHTRARGEECTMLFR
jgi:hypothetical protein